VLSGFKKERDYIEELRKYRTVLKGTVAYEMDQIMTKRTDLRISKELDLYAYAVHAFSMPGVESARHPDIDIVTIRECSEGEYRNIEHEVTPGVVRSVKLITQEKSERIARYAFEYAVAANRKKITCVHKANIMKLADGEFIKAAKSVAEEFPQIEYEEMIVDATCMNLTLKPEQFDVMLLPNLYGSIIGSVVAGLVGGPGIAPGCNIGEDHAIFEQGARHSAEDLVVSKKANPTAFLLSSVMMLRHLQLPYFSNTI